MYCQPCMALPSQGSCTTGEFGTGSTGCRHRLLPTSLIACRAVSNERWDATLPLPNVTSLISRIGWRDNGFCLDVPGASAEAGLQVQLWTCNGTLAQRWVVGFA